jgi:hypothetical protein
MNRRHLLQAIACAAACFGQVRSGTHEVAARAGAQIAATTPDETPSRYRFFSNHETVVEASVGRSRGRGRPPRQLR